MLISVLLSRNCINLSSSSFTISLSMCKSLVRFMVSNAADMSIPVIWTLSLCITLHFAASHRWVHTTSAVLLFGWKPLFLDDDIYIYCKTAGLILPRAVRDRAFLIVFKRLSGLKFLTGPLGFPGLGGVIMCPELISKFSGVSRMLLKQSVMVSDKRWDPYL